MKGNITIEASIIVPFIMFVFAFLIIGSIVIYDLMTLWTYQSLKLDVYAMTGEELMPLTKQKTLIINANYEEMLEDSTFNLNVTSLLEIYYDSGLFDYVFDRSRENNVQSVKAKSFIRAVDFLDDASDMFVSTREAKETYKEVLKNIEETLSQ